MDLESNSVFPTATENYKKTWAYALPARPTKRSKTPWTGKSTSHRAFPLNFRTVGLRGDISGDDELTSIVCNANLSNCYGVPGLD